MVRHEQVVHGSLDGYLRGCKSKGGCVYHLSEEYLSCVEAAVQRRSDFPTSQMPSDQPVRRQRSQQIIAATEPEHSSVSTTKTEVHGTVWGYRRGCHNRHTCPNWRRGQVTCTDARRRYFDRYRQRRLQGEGKPVDHGTSRGYLTGCRDRSTCPGRNDGTTCPDARREHKLELARRAGIQGRSLMDPASAVRVIEHALATGHSLRSIARAAGIGAETLRSLVASVRSGQPRQVAPQTIQRLANWAHTTDKATKSMLAVISTTSEPKNSESVDPR